MPLPPTDKVKFEYLKLMLNLKELSFVLNCKHLTSCFILIIYKEIEQK